MIIIFTLAWICSSDQKHHPIRLSQFLSHIFVRIGQLGICSKIRLLSFNVNELLNFGNPDIFNLWINLKNWNQYLFLLTLQQKKCFRFSGEKKYFQFSENSILDFPQKISWISRRQFSPNYDQSCLWWSCLLCVVFSKLDVVQLCETQKVRLFHVMVGLMGLCGWWGSGQWNGSVDSGCHEVSENIGFEYCILVMS